MLLRHLVHAAHPALALVAGLALTVTLSGCGHTETHVAMLRAPQPQTDHTVELYVADQAPPARPFYDIGIVQAIGFGGDANGEDITHALTVRASQLGCDAVVRVFIDIGYSRAHASGVCVKFLGSGPPGPAPVLPPPKDRNPPPPALRPAPIPRLEPLPSSPRQGR